MPEDPKKTPPEIELEPSERKPKNWPPKEGGKDVTPPQGYDVHTPVDPPPDQKFDTSTLPPGEQMTAGGVPFSLKKRVERGLPKDDPKAGHRKGLGADFSAEQDPITGDVPASVPYSGAIAPKLLGDRSRAKALMDSIGEFVDKYAPLATQNFPGYKAGSVPVGPFGHTPVGKKGTQRRDAMKQTMSQDKAHQLLDAMPMMPTEKIIDAVRVLANYVWRIHHEARAELRRRAVSIVAKQGVSDYDVVKKGVNDRYSDRTGEAMPAKDPASGRIVRGPDGKPIKQYQLAQQVDTRGELFKNTLANLSREFNEDSARIKSDMTVLMNAAGNIARAGGKGSRADAEFLEKIRQFPQHLDPDDPDSPLVQVPPKIVARPPEAPIAPELQHLAGDYERPKRASLEFKPKPEPGAPRRTRRATLANPIKRVQKLSDLDEPPKDDDTKKEEALSRFLDTILEGLL